MAWRYDAVKTDLPEDAKELLETDVNVIWAGEEMPGITTVQVSSSLAMDIKAPAGGSPTITCKGKEALKVDITLTMHLPEQVVAWEQMLKKMGDRMKPIDVSHPKLLRHGITSILVQNILDPNVSDQLQKIQMQCVQWFPPPKPNKKTSTKTPKEAEKKEQSQGEAAVFAERLCTTQSNPASQQSVAPLL